MLALKVSAVLVWLVAAGFGIPAPFVASHFLRERTPLALLPIEAVSWAGFAVPFPPLIAIARLGLPAAGWSALK